MALVTRADVGRPFSPDKTRFEPGVRLSLLPEGAQLHLIIPAPAPPLIDAVTSGELHYQWAAADALAILRVRLTGIDGVEHLPWHDTAYRARMDQHAGLTPLSRAPGSPQPLPASVSLLDAATGIIRAARTETWPGPIADQIRAVAAAYTPYATDTRQEIRQLTGLRDALERTAPGTYPAWSTVADQ